VRLSVVVTDRGEVELGKGRIAVEAGGADSDTARSPVDLVAMDASDALVTAAAEQLHGSPYETSNVSLCSMVGTNPA